MGLPIRHKTTDSGEGARDPTCALVTILDRERRHTKRGRLFDPELHEVRASSFTTNKSKGGGHWAAASVVRHDTRSDGGGGELRHRESDVHVPEGGCEGGRPVYRAEGAG
jgi:hypothetical protein